MEHRPYAAVPPAMSPTPERFCKIAVPKALEFSGLYYVPCDKPLTEGFDWTAGHYWVCEDDEDHAATLAGDYSRVDIQSLVP